MVLLLPDNTSCQDPGIVMPLLFTSLMCSKMWQSVSFAILDPTEVGEVAYFY
jgi:hypothetical protein